MRSPVPLWATQFLVGAFAVLVGATLVIALVSNATRLPGQFFDEVGRTMHRILPKEGPDLTNDTQLKAVIRTMPDGRLRVGAVIPEDDVVVFTVTAKRSEVRAAVVPGDQLRISRTTGELEIAPQGVPGVIDRLGEELRKLKERFFGP